MNNQKKHCWPLWVFVALLLAAAGCTGKKNVGEEPQMLIVKRQHVKVNAPKPDACEFVEFYVDVPVEGPQPLLDSIKAFLNENLYLAFEAVDFEEDSTWFTPKDVYADDMSSLLDSYVGKYSEHLKNMEWIWTSSFSFFLVAQTESFVTYGLEAYQGRGSVMYCHTFSKKDGHEVGEIITKENLLRFLKNHPDVKHPFYNVDLLKNKEVSFDFGLLEDGALCIAEPIQNCNIISKFGYKELLPYLSTEAQELVNSIGNKKCLYEDWSLGEEIGRVKTPDGETVCLMQRPPLWADFVFESENEDFYQDKTYTLTAYTLKDGHHVKNDKILPTPRLEFEFPDVAWSGPHFEEKDYYRWDPTQNLLLAPYRKGDALVDFILFKFDGKHFVKIGD